MITRAVYSQVEVSNLHLNNSTCWNVAKCRPKFRRDQVAKGLATISDVDAKAARQLAMRIPAAKYPACIEDVRKYCCENIYSDCKGAKLYGDVQVCIDTFI